MDLQCCCGFKIFSNPSCLSFRWLVFQTPQYLFLSLSLITHYRTNKPDLRIKSVVSIATNTILTMVMKGYCRFWY